jgi:hypothetical protein
VKLSNKAAKRIASLINSIQVGESMRAEARAKGDLAGQDLWTIHYMKATIALHDEFGITLPCYDAFLISLPEHERMYRERTAKAA